MYVIADMKQAYGIHCVAYVPVLHGYIKNHI